MRRSGRVTAVVAILGSCVAATLPATAAAASGTSADLPAAGTARPARTGVVSAATDGTWADGESLVGSVSADGRFAVFESRATNLVPGKPDLRNVYVKDLRSGALEQVSVATDGTRADGPSYNASISGDGRYVVFTSEAGNLAPGQNPAGGLDVFVRDRRTGRTDALLTNAAGTRASNRDPSISADGRFVAFASTRSDLVPGDTNEVADVFVQDRVRGTVRRVSVAADGSQANGFSASPVISADGGTVGFKSAARLVPEPDEGGRLLAPHPRARAFYVHELRTGRTQRGAQALDGGAVAATGSIALSPDGRYALYSSVSASIVPDDTNGKTDVFAKDLRTGRTQRLSVAPDGSQADEGSYDGAVMSADGRTAYFTSTATNLVPGDTNGHQDLFARDLRTGAVERLNLAPDGAQDDGDASGVSVDLTGRVVVFGSSGGNLVPGDVNGVHDVFWRRVG
ncbi:TolB family protein [Streptomyces albireticuli]|uniref:TolB family protein n=1 Tax=Streptomyces albireticuli TaxID=1940 RepID=UPI0036A97AA3